MKKFLNFVFILTLLSGSNLYAVELFSWGFNSNGQLGDGTTTNRTSPVQIGSDSDWKMVNCGLVHNAAIKNNGTLWTWGFNRESQLGDGTTIDRHSPIQVGSDSDWSQVACGWLHSVAVKKDGTLWAWGDNSWGQLGDGTRTTRKSPVKIGNSSDWKFVSCGEAHNIALKNDGTLWAWGYNGDGQLGDGSTIDKVSPIKIGNSNDWSQVTCGVGHTIAIKTDNTLWAWGGNFYGQLGDNSNSDKTSPIQIGTQMDWKLVETGKYHSLAIKSDGTLWAWGYNGQGRLGDGTNTNRYSPVQIGNETNWANVSAGEIHSIGIKNDGSVWNWGYNNKGQLADGTTIDRYSPVRVGISNDWAYVSCGSQYAVCLFGVSEPEVATGSVTEITVNSALCGGNVVNDGGRNVTARGVCWATSENPTIADNYTTNGSGIGSFTSSITGLSSNNKYYVRTYATNSVGTSYGEQKSFQTLQKQVIPLSSGWNMISINILPTNPDMEEIWKSIASDLVIVKNSSGGNYIPEFDINTIGNWTFDEGYQVYMKNNNNLTITGTSIIPEDTDINLPQGWSIISYLRNTPREAQIALGTLTANDALVIAKNNDGKSFIPQFDINDIGMLQPGEGYQVYLSDAETLTYPKNAEAGTIEIGNQIWTAKNLDVSTYRNGDPIRYASSDNDWIDAGNKNEGAWCYYNNDPANGAVYGKLYNWYAVNDSRGLAPSGYHVSNNAEWTTLGNYLKSNSQYWCSNNISYIAKSLASEELWHTNSNTCAIGNNLNANNITGFTALPGGYRNNDGSFGLVGYYGLWWSATDINDTYAWVRALLYDYASLGGGDNNKVVGFSVRCVKD